jgi:hypothetical protein
MEVKVKLIGLSEPPPGFERSKELPIDFPGDSLGALIQQLVTGMGMETGGNFLDEQGGISTDLTTIVNGIMISDSNRGNFRLKEGDLVELVSSPG